MPRPAKPYLCRGWYVSNLGGKRHRLCREADGLKAARDALVALQREVQGNGGRPFPGLTVIELIALFLDSVKVERTVHTYLDYQRWLTEFAKGYGHRQARDITRQDAQQFRNRIAYGTWVRNLHTRINSLAVEVMQDLGIEMEGHSRSRSPGRWPTPPPAS